MPGDDVIRGRQPLWGCWVLGDLLYEDGNMAVYAARGKERQSAEIRLYSFPTERHRRQAEASCGGDPDALSGCLEEGVGEIIQKIHLQYSLGAHRAILHFQDYLVYRAGAGPRWQIAIRTAHVLPLDRYLQYGQLDSKEVTRLGIELCDALSFFMKKGIVHGDIRDDNIFVAGDGSFKLGDCGVSRELCAYETKGPALLGAAPEALRGEDRDHGADIYALGALLYRLLNRGRMPHLPPHPRRIGPADLKSALDRNIKGKPLPPPPLAGKALGALVLKACSFEPSRRFATPVEMKRELELLAGEPGGSGLEESATPGAVAQPGPAQTPPAAGPGEQERPGRPDVAPPEPAAASDPGASSESAAPPGPAAPPEPAESAAPDRQHAKVRQRLLKVAAAALVFAAVAGAVLLLLAEKPLPVVEGCGNTAGNINNGGLVAFDGDTVYYTNVSDGYAIYRFDRNGGDAVKLNDYRSASLNVSGDWIYYINRDHRSHIFKMKIDGSQNQVLLDDYSLSLLLTGGWLYYINVADNASLYRVRPDGAERTALGSGSVMFVNVAGDWIYYLGTGDRYIYKMRTDGSERTRLNDHLSWGVQVAGAWVYYRNDSDGWRLYRIGKDGSAPERLTADAVNQFIVSNGSIYYTSYSDHFRLYSMKRQDTGWDIEIIQTRLNDDHTVDPNIAAGWIYYLNHGDGDRMYRIKTDGSKREPVR